MSIYSIIKNVHVFANLLNNRDSFTRDFNLSFIPDEMRVHQISYNGLSDPLAEGSFLVWCSLISDYIGTFSISEVGAMTTHSVNVNPRTVVKLSPNIPPNQITFELHEVNTFSKATRTTVLPGNLVINMDFIQYKK